MADIQRHGQAHWSGDLLHGSGKIYTGSGALKGMAYSVPSRFECRKGTNPEELLAAAHAACFSMMLAKVLGDEQKSLKTIDTRATLTLVQRTGAWRIITIRLDVEATGDGLIEETLKRAAEPAKEQCPGSLLPKPGLESITLAARLKGGS